MTTSLVVKVGGSLYDLPDLAARLHGFLATSAARRIVLFPGGGPFADVVRALDRSHRLGEETSHWLALRTLDVAAHFLHALLPDWPVVDWQCVLDFERAPAHRVILAPHSFACTCEASATVLPHSWDATSDSLALHAAALLNADLTLLKSVHWSGESWHEAAQLGIVDPCFPQLFQQTPRTRIQVRCLRD